MLKGKDTGYLISKEQQVSQYDTHLPLVILRIKEESNQKDEEIKKLRHQVEVNRYERRVRGKNINKQRTLKKNKK